MPREAMHKKGEQGVDLARQILESTTWVELPFNSYDNEAVCTLELMDGTVKCFDAMGYIFRDPKTPLWVEAKNYDSAGGDQNYDYKEFLANAYSITAKDLSKKTDGKREFMWFTKHPFSLKKWSQLISISAISEALDAHPGVLNGNERDAEIMATVSSRIWLILVHHKQTELTLSADELGRIEAMLNRKGR